METEIERKLREEADFGDLVEITLNSEVEYCARHNKGNVIISPRENDLEYQERGILHISGYYGGMRSEDFREAAGVTEREVGPFLIYSDELIQWFV